MAGIELPDGIGNGAQIAGAREPATGPLLGQAEAATAKRCFNCGGRVHNGFRFTFYWAQFVVEVGGRVGIAEERVYCVREGCGPAIEEARAEATCVEPVEIVWLDELRGDKSAPLQAQAGAPSQ